MDTLLLSGDHAVDGRGLPIAVSGAREIIQRALIRLGVKKGSFDLHPELGSDLHKLCGVASDNRDRIALNYVREALLPIDGMRVLGVECRTEAPDSLYVDVSMELNGNQYTVETPV